MQQQQRERHRQHHRRFRRGGLGTVQTTIDFTALNESETALDGTLGLSLFNGPERIGRHRARIHLGLARRHARLCHPAGSQRRRRHRPDQSRRDQPARDPAARLDRPFAARQRIRRIRPGRRRQRRQDQHRQLAGRFAPTAGRYRDVPDRRRDLFHHRQRRRRARRGGTGLRRARKRACLPSISTTHSLHPS